MLYPFPKALIHIETNISLLEAVRLLRSDTIPYLATKTSCGNTTVPNMATTVPCSGHGHGRKRTPYFEGDVSVHDFLIMRRASYVDGANPMLHGTFLEKEGKITVRVEMTLNDLILKVWSLIALLFLLFYGIAYTMMPVTEVLRNVTPDLFFIGVLLIGYGLVQGFFILECSVIRQHLVKLFSAEKTKVGYAAETN